MAQVKNKVQSHTWSIEKTIAKKELNASLWPFKIIRDKGKPSKMECRSLSALEESFKGTKYNLNECPSVLSRYSLLYNALKKLSTSKITHLFITSDYFCYKIIDENGSHVGKQDFAKQNYSMEDVVGLANSVLFKSKWLSVNVSNSFNAYKKTNGEYINNLYDSVQTYIDKRTHIKEMDNYKGFLDVLKSDLSFSSLRYLFIGVSKDSIYLREKVEQYLNSSNIDISFFKKELSNIPSRDSELNRYVYFLGNLKNNGFSTIKKVFYVTDNLNDYVNKSDFETLFNDVEDYSFARLQVDYVSEAEKQRVQNEMKKKNEEKIAKETEENRIDNLNYKKFEEIMPLIQTMVDFFGKSENIYNEGLKKGTVEFDIWIKYFNTLKLQERINEIYNYNRKINETFEKYYPISTILNLLALRYGKTEYVESIKYFNDFIVPKRYKDDRRTLQSIGCDIKTIEGLKLLNKILTEIEKDVIRLFEVFLGVYYGTFGSFMKRYGIAGLSISKMLLPSLIKEYENKSFIITHNIKEYANECFYMIYKDIMSLEGYTPELARSDEQGGIGKFADFVMLYLESLSGLGVVEELVHSGKKAEDYLHYFNVVKVAECVYAILSQCLEIQNIDVNSKEISELFIKVLNNQE